jgi:hypothetical protein
MEGSLTELEKMVRLMKIPKVKSPKNDDTKSGSTKVKISSDGNVIKIKQDEDKLTFLQRVQAHLQQIPPQVQLDEFNAIQQNAPFLLVDPESGDVNNVIYGYYDLVAFMNRTFNSDPMKDPFVAHTPHSQNSIMMNNLMLQLYRNNPLTQAAYVQEFLKRAREQYGALPKDGMVSKEDYAILKRIADDAAQKVDSYFSPPMDTHQSHVEQKEFDRIFRDFSKALLTYKGRDEILKKHKVKVPSTHGKYINATNPYKVEPRSGKVGKVQVANPVFDLLNR